MNEKYKDIIDMPHHVSTKRAHMPLQDRAAQFAPFAALTGYDRTIDERGRLTDRRIELDETEKAVINEQLQLALSRLQRQPVIRVTYFVADELKEGGSYRTICDRIVKVDEIKRDLIMEDKTRIPIDDMIEFEYCDKE